MKTAEDIDFNLVYKLVVENGFFVSYKVAVITRIKKEFGANTHEAAKVVDVLEQMGVRFVVRKRRKLRRRKVDK